MPRTLLAMIAVAAIAAMFGCSEEGGRSHIAPPVLDPDEVNVAVATGMGIDPELYHGDIAFRVDREVPTEAGTIPVVLYLGLAPAADTRLHAEAFIDLRPAQIRLPELLSGVVVDNCGQQILLDFAGATAARDTVRAFGSVEARFYNCRNEGSSEEERGRRLFTQQVDAVAVATASVRENCIAIRLVDLELDPKGILGGLASIFGLTERVRASILGRSATVFAENPICPALPAELASLDLRFTSGGPREIASGGMGAALAGSVDTSAATLVSLLAVMKERGVLERAR